MTEWDADRNRAVDPDAGRITDEEMARLRADIEWLRGKYAPPQPRDPQEGQLALPIDGGDGDDERATPEGASE